MTEHSPALPLQSVAMPTPVWSSVDHYENFPVASVLMPAHLRPVVISIYRFARTADDIADEGDHSADDRLALLAELDRALCESTAPAPEVIVRLRPEIERHHLPVDQLRALLAAFAQDVSVRRYADRGAVIEYCTRSANPIGRLLLCLFKVSDPQALRWSDNVCTALQLINFLQDIAIDWEKGRVYLPQEQLQDAGATDDHIARAVSGEPVSPELRRVIDSELRFAAGLLASGAQLIGRVPLRLSLELRAIIAGGQRIIERISQARGDVFSRRPTLGWSDTLSLIRLALSPPRSNAAGVGQP